MANLDERCIIRIGAEVEAGDILVGKGSFGANTPATRGFPGQTTRPFGSGGLD